jgi:4-hydroxy-3-methylbut-2-enyl diphosphate reductase
LHESAAAQVHSPNHPPGAPRQSRLDASRLSIYSFGMSTDAPSAPQKINLRRPDIMEAVQAQVLSHYRSELVERIRAHGGVLSADSLTVKLAKEFGFCYGVERAIDLAYAAKKYFSEVSPSTPIYLLGEIIHNPEVNDQIRNMGIQIVSPKPNDEELARMKSDDVVIIPAFGTEVGTRKKIEAKGCKIVDTTCGDVMSVWKRVRQYSKENVTSIIHGKAKHEETKATTSQARAYGSGHYLVVFNLAETDYVCNYILRGGNKQEFLEKFKGAYSNGFDPDLHLQAVGVANQTTMLRGETEEVQRRIKNAMIEKYGAQHIDEHFRFFDTICGATQDRQDALQKLLAEPPDLLIVIGGYNSSNTSHLAEMGEAKLPTYFIKNAAKMKSDKLIQHYDQHRREEIETQNWLPPGKITVGITAGASCPNNLIEDTIRRLFELRGISVQQLLASS